MQATECNEKFVGPVSAFQKNDAIDQTRVRVGGLQTFIFCFKLFAFRLWLTLTCVLLTKIVSQEVI